ncbi:hypothetical protein [Parapedobacter lycopersici]|uniref:hypothetical protein n=1 Tax=Parapedobacter lycopersici TaxID=1864939 RepID=UPI00333EC81A
MKEAIITVRGKTTTIRYMVLDRHGLFYARVTWENGTETFFYKGMYGIKNRWENIGMPDDLIQTVSEIFNKETPVKDHVVNYWKMPPK